MIGKTNAGSGGGIELYIVGGTTRPASPRENTIWLETSDAITGWEVGCNRPASASEGNVFISVDGATSATDLEISGNTGKARKQVVKISPSYGSQYINGAWVSKPMKTYVNGVWVDSVVMLYDRGTYSPQFATGWSAGEQTTYVGVQTGAGGRSASVSNGSYDLTQIRTVQIEYSAQRNLSGGAAACTLIIYGQDGSTELRAVSVDSSGGLAVSNIDVTDINQVARFGIVAQAWAGSGGAEAITVLYSVKVIP